MLARKRPRRRDPRIRGASVASTRRRRRSAGPPARRDRRTRRRGRTRPRASARTWSRAREQRRARVGRPRLEQLEGSRGRCRDRGLEAEAGAGRGDRRPCQLSARGARSSSTTWSTSCGWSSSRWCSGPASASSARPATGSPCASSKPGPSATVSPPSRTRSCETLDAERSARITRCWRFLPCREPRSCSSRSGRPRTAPGWRVERIRTNWVSSSSRRQSCSGSARRGFRP